VNKRTTIAIVGVLLLAIVVGAVLQAQPEEETLVIVFSPAPGIDPATAKGAYGGIAAELEQKLGVKVEMKTTTDYAATTASLEPGGGGDIARLGGEPLIQAYEHFGVEPIVREINPNGIAEYHGILIARPGVFEHPFNWDHLRGKSVAFPDVGSTSGYLSNLANMQAHGIYLDDLGEYGFPGSHPLVFEAVLAGSVDVGGTNDWRTELACRKGGYEEGVDFVILAKSPPIPMNAWAVRPDMPAGERKAIQEALLSLSEEAFDQCEQIKGFVPATIEDYDYVRQLMELTD
jgi:phosphate/phosphite/phosphonate ABC transporter binding protein